MQEFELQSEGRRVALPPRLVAKLGKTGEERLKSAQEALVVDLFRRSEISSGLAAEFLGMDRQDFFDVLNRHKVSLFDCEDGVLEEQVATAGKLLDEL